MYSVKFLFLNFFFSLLFRQISADFRETEIKVVGWFLLGYFIYCRSCHFVIAFLGLSSDRTGLFSFLVLYHPNGVFSLAGEKCMWFLYQVEVSILLHICTYVVLVSSFMTSIMFLIKSWAILSKFIFHLILEVFILFRWWMGGEFKAIIF